MNTKMRKVAQSFFDSADVFMIAINFNEVVADINKKGYEILEYSQDEIVGKNWFDNFLPKTTKQEAKRIFHEVLEGKLRHVHSEYPVKTKRGMERVFNWHNILVSDEKGATIGVISSGDDVTERKQSEESRINLENRLQMTLDSMLEGCQIIDYDWRYVYINESAAKQGRQTKKELMGRTMIEMYPGIENTPMFSILKESMNTRVHNEIENEFIFPDGSRGWFELRVEPAPEGIMILSADITRRKEAEEELKKYRQRLEQVVTERTAECAKTSQNLSMEIEERRKTEEGLRLRATILDHTVEAILLINVKGDIAYANKAASKLYGYNNDELLNLNLRQMLQPKETKFVESILAEAIQKGSLEREALHLRKDKSVIKVETKHNLIKTEHGQFIVSIIREISE